MFVYQNKTGDICVTFAAGKPVAAPEYVIAIDEAARKLYTVAANGDKTAIPLTNTVEYPEVEPEVVTPVAPAVDTIDNVKENDETYEAAPHTEADNTGAPSVDKLDDVTENDAEDIAAPNTEADITDAPTVEELDDIEENDETADETADAE